MSLRVLSAAGAACVQDLGRPGHAHEGVPRGGAADALSLELANRAVGNAPDAAGVEVSFGGLRLRAEAPCVLALSAGEGAFAPIGIGAGEVVEVAPDAGLARACVAVAGGIDVPTVMGSRGTLASAGVGGLEGRTLRAGDTLAIGTARGKPAAIAPHVRALADFARRRRVLRVVVGAADAPPPRGLVRVTPSSDRVGVRLARGGRRDATQASGPSRGVLHGTIQAPSAGELVILGPDGPTTGGYATAGTVIAADLPAVGQLVPGQWVRFEAVSRDQAVAVLAARARALGLGDI